MIFVSAWESAWHTSLELGTMPGTIFFLSLASCQSPFYSSLAECRAYFFGARHGARHDFWGPWLGTWHILLELGMVPGTIFGVLGLLPGILFWSLALCLAQFWRLLGTIPWTLLGTSQNVLCFIPCSIHGKSVYACFGI